MLEYLQKNKFKSAAGVFLVLTLITAAFSNLYIKYSLNPKLKTVHNDLQPYQSAILADLELLDKNPIFQEPKFERNADEVLKGYVSLLGDKVSPISNAEHILLKNLALHYSELEDIKYWDQMKDIDTSWMKQLDKYDYWDFSNRPEIAADLEKAKNLSAIEKGYIFSKLPIASYAELKLWNKINFIKLSKEGKYFEALKTQRKIAALSNSTGLLIGQMIAVFLLKEEHSAVEKYQIENWSLVPPNIIESYKKVSWAWVGLLQYPIQAQNFSEKFLPYMKFQNGTCAGAWESAGGFSLYVDYLEPKFIFEPDYASEITYAKNIMQNLSEICHLASYNNYYQRTPASANPMIVENSYIGPYFSSFLFNTSHTFKTQTEPNWSQIPYVRKVIALALITNTKYSSSWFKYYDEKKAAE